MTVELQDAEKKLAELAESAANGEDVILVREGKPVARMTTLTAEMPTSRLGMLDGMYEIPDDFDTMLEKEIEEMFYGDSSKG
jgi:antitoxin (DNA-binding transcriptional repressor) of toxin-antitoxin stability system